jgi:hypothetical protein
MTGSREVMKLSGQSVGHDTNPDMIEVFTPLKCNTDPAMVD